MFITLEGIDGSGKTSLGLWLVDRLSEVGIRSRYTYEPRLDLFNGEAPTFDRPFTYLAWVEYLRSLHIVEIWGWLSDGEVVVCDRFTDSTLVYQSGVFGLSSDLVIRLNDAACEYGEFGDILRPDLTILLDLPVKLALERLKNRDGEEPGEDVEWVLHRASKCYRRLSELYKGRIIVIDSSGPFEEVCDSVWSMLSNRLSL